MATVLTSMNLFEDTFMCIRQKKDIEAINNTARRIVMLLSGIVSETGENFCTLISESISPTILFNRAVAPFPSFWTELRKLPVTRGITLRAHQRHRAIYTVANNIFLNKEEKESAFELCRKILSGTIYQDTQKNSVMQNVKARGESI